MKKPLRMIRAVGEARTIDPQRVSRARPQQFGTGLRVNQNTGQIEIDLESVKEFTDLRTQLAIMTKALKEAEIL